MYKGKAYSLLHFIIVDISYVKSGNYNNYLIQILSLIDNNSMPSHLSVAEKDLLRQAKAFASPIPAVSIRQVMITISCFVATLAAMSYLGAWKAWLLIPVWSLLAVRLFILQHDCGHKSLFSSKWANHWTGRFLSVFTGVAHDGWRAEHDWHHQVTGRLDRRGIDLFNSPMTTEEAQADPKRAHHYNEKVQFWNIAWLGMLALIVDRKRRGGFFVFKEGFVWGFDSPANVVVGLWATNMAHALLHVLYIVWLGWAVWLTAVIPAHVVASMIGATLFWIQHNYETSYVADGGSWNFVRAALEGSSYVRLPRPLAWFTADIGIHHVHHMSPKIPNYRLEEARVSVSALRAVAPMTRSQFASAFTHHFWNRALARRQTLRAAL